MYLLVEAIFWSIAGIASLFSPRVFDPMAQVSAADRRSVLSSVRGVALAAHSAAGISRGVDKECERLLSCCEGIARAAVARLETLGRRLREPPPAAPHCSGGAHDAKEVETAEVDKPKRKQRRRPKKKKRELPSVSDTAVDVQGSELGDEWADTVSVRHQSQEQALPLATTSAAPRVLVRGDSDEAGQPKHKLARGAPTTTLSTASASFAASGCSQHPLFEAGQTVILHNLATRPDLSEAMGKVVRFVPETSRFGVQLEGGEVIAVRSSSMRASIFGATW